jgi:Outer membrane protein Omp28
MIRVLRYSLSCLLIAFVAGCDVIKAPYLDAAYLAQLPADEFCLIEAAKQDPYDPAQSSVVKRVLVEEMTGHKCGNCPRAHEEVIRLESETFKERMIPISIHAGPLSSFTPGASKYFTNFTTEAGIALYTSLNTVNAVPFGMIDRNISNTDYDTWEGHISSRLTQSPGAGIRIFTCYNPDSNTVGVVVNVKYFEAASDKEYLSVYVVEDPVIDWQKDYDAPNGSPDIPAYPHRHVLRAALNGTWGEPLSAGGLSAGGRVTKSYSFKFPTYINPAQSHIVAFVHNVETHEVRQAEIRGATE